MKEKTLIGIHGALLLLSIPFAVFFLSNRQHHKKQTIQKPLPIISVSPKKPKPIVSTPTPTITASKAQYYKAFLEKLPISGTITTNNNLSVDYTITHDQNLADNIINIDMTNINFQVQQTGQDTCEKNVQIVSTDLQNVAFWCNYTYNKTNFQFVAKYIFTTYLPNETTPQDFSFVWGNREFIQTQATSWLKEVL